MKNPSRTLPKRAFSLIELLVVMAIIAIVAGFAVPAVGTISRGSQLNHSSQAVIDQLALARQMALSRNRAMQVRFYKYGDPEVPGQSANNPTTGTFRAMQTFEVLENGGMLPVSGIIHLPNTVVMNESDQLSTLLSDTARKNFHVTKAQLVGSDPSMPNATVGKNYDYFHFNFRPDGSTNLPSAGPGGDTWFVTLHNTNVATGGGNDGQITIKPANYVTIQIDPVSGVTRVYRPTAR